MLPLHEYQKTKAVAKRLNVDPSRVRHLLKEGRLPGAEKIGNAWLIPKHAEIQPPPKKLWKAGTKLERNALITRLHTQEGRSYASLAREFGLDYKRVVTIVQRQLARDNPLSDDPRRKDERNAEIVRRYEGGGETYASLSLEFGVSKERIRQIILRHRHRQRMHATH